MQFHVIRRTAAEEKAKLEDELETLRAHKSPDVSDLPVLRTVCNLLNPALDILHDRNDLMKHWHNLMS